MKDATAGTGAGHSIIDKRYSRMAAQRKRLRLFNNLALFATVLYLSTRVGQGNILDPFAGPSKASPNELLSAAAEALTWLFFAWGLGFGRAQREQEWVLRTAMLLASGALISHVMVLNPARIREIGEGVHHASEHPAADSLHRGVAGLAEPLALGFRIGTIVNCASFLKDKALSAKKKL